MEGRPNKQGSYWAGFTVFVKSEMGLFILIVYFILV